jgi:cyclohexyl-isocyanide hydratase
MSEARFRSGMLLFPNLTQLDLTGPYEVLARLPGAETLLLWKSMEPVRSEHGLTILPMATFEPLPRSCPRAGRGRDQPAARGC